MTRVRETPRSSDDRLLSMLARRCSGESCQSIAASLGTSPSNISEMTRRVRADDEAHVGRDLSEAYW